MNDCSRHALRPLLALAALMTVAMQAAATPCVYRGNQDTVRVIDRTGTSYRPFPQTFTHMDCSKLRLVGGTGTVMVYPMGGSSLPAAGTLVTQGPLIGPVGAAGKEPATGALRIFSVLSAVLESGERVVSGSSRSSEADYLRNSLPTGRLAEPVEDLRIPLGPANDPNLRLVELQVGGRTVYQQALPAREIVLPARQLRAGTQVRWRVVYGADNLSGELEVVTPARLAELAAVSSAAAADGDAFARDLQAAQQMAEAGFIWDARRVLQRSLAQP